MSQAYVCNKILFKQQQPFWENIAIGMLQHASTEQPDILGWDIVIDMYHPLDEIAIADILFVQFLKFIATGMPQNASKALSISS